MSNEQFKIDSGASLFNLKETFNAAMEQFAHDGTSNRAPNPNFEMVHKDSSGIDRLHGWTFTPAAGSTAGATPGNYTKTQSKITWNLGDGDVATMSMSGRLNANSRNEFGFLIKFKTNKPVLVSISSTVGMLLNNEIGQGIGYFRTGEDHNAIGDLNNPTATFPNLFTWAESDSTTISTSKKLFLPQSLTDYIMILIPIKFTVTDIESEIIEFKIEGLGAGTLFDVQKMVVKEGFFEREFMAAEDKIAEHTRYNPSSGHWEISQDGENWSEILTTDTPLASHTHMESQISDLDVNGDISAYLDNAIANGTQSGMIVSHNGATPELNFSVSIDHSLYLDKATYDSGNDGIVDNSAQISDGGANIVTAVQARGHLDDATIHRAINDAGTASTELWSASKLTTDFGNRMLSGADGSNLVTTGTHLNLTAAMSGKTFVSTAAAPINFNLPPVAPGLNYTILYNAYVNSIVRNGSDSFIDPAGIFTTTMSTIGSTWGSVALFCDGTYWRSYKTGRVIVADAVNDDEAVTLSQLNSTVSGVASFSTNSGLQSKIKDTVYTNSTGKPLFVGIQIYHGASGNSTLNGYVDAVKKVSCIAVNNGGAWGTLGYMAFVVPPGSAYYVTWTVVTGAILYWYEAY